MGRKDVSVERSRIRTKGAPAAIGPYSQAIMVGDTLYCSGQIAIDPATGHMISDGLEAEAEQVLNNLRALLHAADLEMEHVVQCRVYLTDMNDYGQVNEIYAQYFGEDAPAREAVQVAALPRGARVEISCTAVR
ncbi:MAG: RidA family protein [Bacteroidetes bacterium]|nr:MAG: RidA family protein [Bacteroidota bacterium]